MKRSSMSILCLLVSCTLYGQAKHRIQTNPVATAGFNTGNKTTAIESRLVGEANSMFEQGMYHFSDSTSYAYGHTRGQYIPDMNSWNYDTSRLFMFSKTTNTYVHDTRFVRNYNANDLCIQEFQQIFDGTIWHTMAQIDVTYDINGNFATYKVQFDSGNGLENESLDHFTFNSNNQIETIIMQAWDATSATWKNDARIVYSYNSAGQILGNASDTFNSLTLSWDPEARFVNTYNAGNITNEQYEVYDNGAFVPSMRYANKYNPAGYKTEKEAFNWDAVNANWTETENELYSYDNNHNVIESIRDIWFNGGYVHYSKSINTYNNYNQLLTANEELWDENSQQYAPMDFSYAQRYHYEEFTAGVEKSTAQNMGMKIYPTPASDNVNISINVEKPGAIVFVLSDMSGKTMSVWADHVGQQYYKQMKTSYLPAGTYVLRAQMGTQIQMQKIIVTH